MLLSESIRVIFALIAVVGMIGLAAIVLRKAGLMTASGGLVRKRRLALIETLAIDARRRVAIIKCDDTEHLIILGANGETVVEKDLVRPLVTPDATIAPANPFPTLKEFAGKFRPTTKNAA